MNVVVADDLYAVAPRVEKIKKWAGQWFYPRVSERLTDGILVVDHKPKMTSIVSGLSPALLQCEELITQIDEGRREISRIWAGDDD